MKNEFAYFVKKVFKVKKAGTSLFFILIEYNYRGF